MHAMCVAPLGDRRRSTVISIVSSVSDNYKKRLKIIFSMKSVGGDLLISASQTKTRVVLDKCLLEHTKIEFPI